MLIYSNEEEDYVGIFGQLRDGGEIQNVGLKNSYFRGRNYIGGVVGKNNGTVENCYNTGNVVGDKWVGGVCGYNDGTNNNCYNTGKVTGATYVGDVCGQNKGGTLTNCYYLADSETNNNDGTFGKTAEQFASGEVAYLLNDSKSTDVAFCQNLDNGERPMRPRFWTAPTEQFTSSQTATMQIPIPIIKMRSPATIAGTTTVSAGITTAITPSRNRSTAYIRSKTPVSCIGLQRL